MPEGPAGAEARITFLYTPPVNSNAAVVVTVLKGGSYCS